MPGGGSSQYNPDMVEADRRMRERNAADLAAKSAANAATERERQIGIKSHAIEKMLAPSADPALRTEVARAIAALLVK